MAADSARGVQAPRSDAARPQTAAFRPAADTAGPEHAGLGWFQLSTSDPASSAERDADAGAPDRPRGRAGDAPPAAVAELGAERPLEDADGWSRKLGADVSGVRVHADPNAQGVAAGLGAAAFSVGERIAFGADRFRPGTAAGDELIRHELAHVLQQRSGRRPLAVYRSPDDDLVDMPRQVPPTTRMAPPGWVLVDDAAGNRWQAPMRIYSVDDIPDTPEYNTRGFPTPNRFSFLQGSLIERAEQQRESDVLTVGEIRAFATGGRRAVRIAMAHTPDGIQPVGVDTWIPARAGTPAAEGFVASAEGTRLVGRDLLVNRIRETVVAGGSSVVISVGNDPDTLEFHRRLTASAGVEGVDVQTGSHYSLDPQNIARLLSDETWGRSLAPGTREALRSLSLAELSPGDLRNVLTRDPSMLRAERGPELTTGIGQIGGRGSPEDYQQRQATVNAGAAVVLAGLTWLSNYLNERFEEEQRPTVQAAFNAQARGAAERLAAHPEQGALFRIVYRQATSPETPITGPRVFGWVEVGYGRTREEALVDILETPAVTSSLGFQEQWLYDTQWVEPAVASQAFELRPPFPRHALAGADGTSVELQDVKWDVGGFDDEGTSTVSVPAGQEIRFHVLSVPSNLRGRDIPIADRAVTGGSIPAVDLDPSIPFTETYAAAIFPANEATRTAFADARELEAYVPFDTRPNLSLLRWIRTGAVRLVEEPREL